MNHQNKELAKIQIVTSEGLFFNATGDDLKKIGKEFFKSYKTSFKTLSTSNLQQTPTTTTQLAEAS